MSFIIFLMVIGFVAGFLARLIVPGPDAMSVAQTWLLGIVGSAGSAGARHAEHSAGISHVGRPAVCGRNIASRAEARRVAVGGAT